MPTPKEFKVTFMMATVAIVVVVVGLWELFSFIIDHVNVSMGWE